jgi:hypothetical protein
MRVLRSTPPLPSSTVSAAMMICLFEAEVWAAARVHAIIEISMQGMILENRMRGLLRASERSFEIDWLQTCGPVFDRGSIWLRRFLIGPQC